MKRILVLISALTLASTANAWLFNKEDLKQNVDEQVRLYASTGASKLSVIPVTLIVKTKFEDQSYDYDEHEDTVEKDCSAVVINPNYLLASQYCKGLSDTATYYTGNAIFGGKRKVEYRKVSGAYIGEEKIFKDRVRAKAVWEDNASKTILIQIDAANEEMQKLLAGKPLANLFIAKAGTELSCVNKAVVSQDSEEVTDLQCNEKGCVALPQKAKNGEPVFFLSQKAKNMEFLAGFNTADVDGKKRESCRTYEVLNPAVETFLSKKIDPAIWPEVKRKIVDESFFNK